MRSFFTKKRSLVALAAIAALAIAGTAFAYFTNSGSGTGTGSVSSVGTTDLSYSQNTLSAMYPGDSAQTLTVTVKNNNTSVSEYVNGVSAYITTNKTGCTGADFKIDGSTSSSTNPVALGWTAQELKAGASASTSGDTVQFNDTNANQNACQGATVTLNYASAA
jgi:hypothetical protein